MREEHERLTVLQAARTLFDAADAGIPVLDRARKIARLKRRTHSLILARRHAAVEDDRLGSTADAAVERTDHDVAVSRMWQPFVANFSASWRGDPERSYVASGFSRTIWIHVRQFWCFGLRVTIPAWAKTNVFY